MTRSDIANVGKIRVIHEGLQNSAQYIAVHGKGLRKKTRGFCKAGTGGYGPGEFINSAPCTAKHDSKAAIVNVPESLGNTLAFVGGRRWVAAWWDLMSQPRVAATEMARMGARTEDVANLMGQEGRRRESLDRIIRDVGLRVTLFQGVNEVNELHAALAGLHFAKDLAAGRTSGIGAERLRLLGFTDDEVVRLPALLPMAGISSQRP